MVCVVQTYDPPHPTYPLVRDITTGNDGSSTTSHTVGLPSGIDAGERLIVVFGHREDDSTSFPAGWDELFDAGTGGQACIVGAYRDCDGTEGASITVTTDNSRRDSWMVLRLSRGNFIAGVAPEVGVVATGSSTTPDCPNLAPSWGAQNTLWIAAVAGRDDVSNYTVSAWPTNYNDNQTSVSVASVPEIFIATRTLNAASENPGTFTLSGSGAWAAQTIAVRIAS